MEKTPDATLFSEAAPKKKRAIFPIAIAIIVLFAAILAGLYYGGVFPPKLKPFSDDPSAIAAVSNSVVMLSCFDKDGELYATGSGFAIFEDGVIVTNYHQAAVFSNETVSIWKQVFWWRDMESVSS